MINRRRFLTITGGAAALTALAGTSAAANPSPPLQRWRGRALGATASITLAHDRAPHLIALARAEIERLERIFSLHRPDSALSRLNETGVLSAPPIELVELLSLCDALHERTGGAFDPSIQPLWVAHARAWAKGRPPNPAQRAEALAMVGWHRVEISAGNIRLGRPGAALTLNGIAQGFIADRITALFRAEGVRDILVDMGEIRASGRGPDGRPWRVGIADPAHPSTALRRVPLTDRALATSAPLGTVLDDTGTAGHILDPRTGAPGGRWRQVSVIAPSAAEADGLSTGFCLMPEHEIHRAARGLRVDLIAR